MKTFYKKLALLLVMGMAFSILAAGCGRSRAAEPAASSEKFVNGRLTQPFTLKVLRGGAFDVTLADQEGFFKQVGLNVSYLGQLEGGTLAQAVIKGDVNVFSSGHVIDIAMARAAGINLTIVLEGMVDSPRADQGHMFYFVRDDGKINSAKDLLGKKIAISSLGSCGEIITDQYLKENNIDKSKVKYVVMNDTEQEQALRQGQIDVAVLHQPYSYMARQKPGLKVLVSSYSIGQKAGDGSAGGLAVRAFSDDFIKQYPAVVEAFIAADVKAQVWSRENFKTAEEVYAKFNGTPVSGGNLTPTETWVIPDKIQFWINMCVNNGFLQKNAVKASDLYTNSLNPYYLKQLKITSPVIAPGGTADAS